MTFENLIIGNPKRKAAAETGRARWFPYYAGFSGDFASQLLASSSLKRGSVLMDPWNGSGTTTSSAVSGGYRAIGFDLNPAMVVVAKAKLLPRSELSSIRPLLADILGKAARTKTGVDERDPLQIWFAPEAAASARRIERAIHHLLVSPGHKGDVLNPTKEISSIASFFYLALFRAVRLLIHRFRGSNPTWITRPRASSCRIRPAASKVRECFSDFATGMASTPRLGPADWGEYSDPLIAVASSESLPVEAGTIDYVLSSPPYCTRIDYGVATLPELAALGFRIDTQLAELRMRLIGTPTINAATPTPMPFWGRMCLESLDRIRSHPSKAAKSYYYKTYVQYFAAMARSLSEVSRCLKSGAPCVLVVQDSYFKEVHIDLAVILSEMARAHSLVLRRRVSFPTLRTFASINTGSRAYRSTWSATESVLCFAKGA